MNGQPVDALDAAGNFFATAIVQPGDNVFEFTAIDALGQTYEYDSDAVDPDDDTLSYSLSVAPEFMAIDQTTGQITWLPTLDDLGAHTVVIRVEDGRGGSAEQRFLLSVIEAPPNRPPYFTSVPVTEARMSANAPSDIPYRYDADATDPDFDPVDYSLLDGPDGMQIDAATGFVTWAPTIGDLDAHDTLAIDPTLPVVPGFDVEIYAEVVDPADISFASNGTLYAGRDNSGSGGNQGSPAKIYKIEDGGLRVEPFGNAAIYDADNVLVDPTGEISGVPGAVLVGGTSPGGGNISVVAPDGQVASLFGQSAVLGNVHSMSFDQTGRLVFVNHSNSKILVSSGDFPEVLISHPVTLTQLAIAHDNRIFTSGSDGRIRIYSPDGNLLNDSFASDQGNVPRLVFGPGGVWGTDLYVINIDSGELLRFDEDGDSALLGTGFSNAQQMQFGPDGCLYVSMFRQDRILRIAPTRETLGLAPNQHAVTIVATDGRGGADQQSFVVEVQPPPDNNPPVIVSEPVTTLVQWSRQEDLEFERMEWTPSDLGFSGASTFGTVPSEDPALFGFSEENLVVIDFDTFPDGTPVPSGTVISDQYASLGVQMNDVIVSSSVYMGAASSPNATWTAADGGEQIRFEFSRPIVAFGIDNTSPDHDRISYYSPTGELLYETTDQVGVTKTGKIDRFVGMRILSDALIGSVVFHNAVGSMELDDLLVQFADGTYQYDADAIDPDDDPIEYSLVTYPEGMTIDSESGLTEWVPPAYLGKNLIINGDAETGDTTGWTSTGIESRTPDQWSAGFGDYVFWGAGGATTQGLTQTIDVSDAAAMIDAGLIQTTFRAQLQSRWDQSIQDTAEVTLTFLEQNGTALGTQHYADPLVHQQYDWTAVRDSLALPVGTRSIEIALFCQRVGGSSNDGVFDDVSLVLEANGIPVTVRARDDRGGVDLQSYTIDVVAPGTGEIHGTKFHDVNVDQQSFDSFAFTAENVGLAAELDSPPANNSYLGLQQLTFDSAVTGLPFSFTFRNNTPANVVWYGDGGRHPDTGLGSGGVSDHDWEIDFEADAKVRSLTLHTNPTYRTSQFRVVDTQGQELGTYDYPQGETSLTVNTDTPIGRIEMLDPPQSGGVVLTALTFEELGLEDWTIYLDQNQNGQRDAGEQWTTTDENGEYAFVGLPEGTYYVAEEQQPGWRKTTPVTDHYTVELGDGSVVTGIDFGNTSTDASGNLPPKFMSDPPTEIDPGDLLRYDAVAVDPNSDPLTFDLVLRPDGMTVHPDRGVLVWQPTLDQVGTHQVVLRVRDGHGSLDLQVFDIDVVPPNTAPEITSTPLELAVADLPYVYHVTAQDADGDPVSFGLDGTIPAGLDIDPATGDLTWTPTSDQIGPHPIAIVASDGQLESMQEFTLEVVATAPNDVPTITSTPRERTRLGSAYVYFVTATDPNGDPLAYHLDTGPTGMSVDAAGVVRWAPTADDLGYHPVTVRVDDGRGGSDVQEFLLEVVTSDTNTAPRVTSTPSTQGLVGRTYRYDLTAWDAEGDPVVWSLDTASVGMSIDPLRGTIRWTPTDQQKGPISVVVRVQDVFFASSTQSFTVDVRGQNVPPAITSPAETSATAESLYVYPVRAVDANGDDLEFRLGLAPAGMAIDAATGLITWLPTVDDAGSHSVRIVVDDGFGGIDTQSYMLDVSVDPGNRPPAITSTPVYAAVVDRLYQYAVTASDVDGDAITFALDRAPVGMAIGETSGLIAWESPTEGEHTISIVVTDANGARATQSYVLFVAPNQAPEITSTPVTTVTAGKTYRYDVRANDPEGDPLCYHLASGPGGMTVDQLGRVTWQTDVADIAANPHSVQLTVWDAYGESFTQSFDIIVTADTVAPSVTLTASANRIDLDGTVTFQVRATDNVDVMQIQLTVGGTPVPLADDGRAIVTMTTKGTIEAIATATDAAGNTGSDSLDVVVIDSSDTDYPLVNIAAIKQLEMDNGQTVYRQLAREGDVITEPVTYLCNLYATVEDTNLLEWRMEYARADLVDVANLGAADPDCVTIASGSSNTTDDTVPVATFDPTVLANDSYVIRLYAVDLMTSKTDQLGHTTAYEYNAAGLQIAEINALGHRISYTYDAYGNQTSSVRTRTDSDGAEHEIVTSSRFDALGRMVEQTDVLGNTLRYQYGSNGQLATVIDHQDRRTEYEYDDAGKLTRTTYWDGTFEETKYDVKEWARNKTAVLFCDHHGGA